MASIFVQHAHMVGFMHLHTHTDSLSEPPHVLRLTLLHTHSSLSSTCTSVESELKGPSAGLGGVGQGQRREGQGVRPFMGLLWAGPGEVTDKADLIPVCSE